MLMFGGRARLEAPQRRDCSSTTGVNPVMQMSAGFNLAPGTAEARFDISFVRTTLENGDLGRWRGGEGKEREVCKTNKNTHNALL